MKKYKKIITEQSVGECQTWTNPSLKMMCETGCLPEGMLPVIYEGNEMPNFKGQEVGQVPSKQHKSYNAVFFGDYDQAQGGNTVMYYSGDTFDAPLINSATKKPTIKKGNCLDMNETLKASYGPDIKLALDSISAYTKGQVVSYETANKNPDLIAQGWELIPLTQAPGYETWGPIISRQLNSRPEIIMVWKMSGAKQYQGDQSVGCKTKYTDLGYKESQKPIGKAGFHDVNLKNDPDCKGYFKTDYWMALDLTKMSDQKLIEKLSNDFQVLTSGLTKSSCRSFITTYSSAYDKKLAITQSNLNRYKIAVNQCKTQFNFMFPWINNKVKELEYASVVTSSTGEQLDYSLQGGSRDIAQESTVKLKNLIKENLIKASENKKRMLIGESKIVKNRLTIISENRVLKTKKQKDKFNNELLSEMIYFNKQGFNKELINEQFWNVLQGIFGNGAEAIMGTFKEYIANWIVGKLTDDTDGWIPQLIITSIGNLDFSEISKLTNCDYLTKFLAKSISETMIKKLQVGADMRNPLFDVMRNAIVETMQDSTLGQKIEKGLVEIICPSLSGIKSKMDVATDKIKQGAISAAN